MQKNDPNIVVIICHDLGQHLGCYGVRGVRSANIDKFAAGSLRFENSFCTAPQCSPSRAALWTGRYPHATGVIGLTHGVHMNDLNPNEKHLAQILRGAGYETHLFGGQHEAHKPERCGHEFIHGLGSCAKIAGDFTAFLAGRKNHDRPLFAQIGFHEPHRPFPHADVKPLPADKIAPLAYLPDIPAVRHDLVELEASIASADKAFGRIIDTIRASAIGGNTIIIFTADHGIGFPRAKMTLYDPGIEVPLLISMPGAGKGAVFNEMISNVDIVPTLLDIIGLRKPANLHGRSFKALLTGGKYKPNDAVFAEKTYHTYYDPMRCIRTKDWKLVMNFECAPWQEIPPNYYVSQSKTYIEAPRVLDKPVYHPPVEMFDLKNDSLEQTNLAENPEYNKTRDALIRRLYRWMSATGDPLLKGPMAQGAYRARMGFFKKIGHLKSVGSE